MRTSFEQADCGHQRNHFHDSYVLFLEAIFISKTFTAFRTNSMALPKSQNIPASFRSGRALVLVAALPAILITVLILWVGGFIGGGSNSLPGTVPSTPTPVTVRTQTQQSDPAFDLLSQAQQAMQSVTSYHFKLDNSVDTNTIDSRKADVIAGIEPQFLDETLYEGDVVPPVARYGINRDPIFSKAIIIGKDVYAYGVSLTGTYHRLNPSATSWDLWNNTGGLNNPTEFINFTFEAARCATIIGEEQIDGVETIHARYNLNTDQAGVRGTDGQYLYARDFWIEKQTHYIRRLQIHEVYSFLKKCEDVLTSDGNEPSYTSGILTYSKHNIPISPPIK